MGNPQPSPIVTIDRMQFRGSMLVGKENERKRREKYLEIMRD